jgi:hypothetical protein
VKPETLPIVRGNPRLGVPYAGISKFVAIGLNYRDHAEEAGLPIPAEPVVFMKATTCLCGPNDDTIVPKNSQKLDYEVELGVVIGTKAQHVPESRALDYVAGYTVVNDVSERHFQMGPGGQWDRGKGCDTFGPVGPWLVTTDEITDPQVLDMWLNVNGEKRQRGQHAHDDLQLRDAGLVREPVHDAAAGRHHHHRHTPGRGARDEAAAVAQGGRRRDARHPGPGRAAPEGPRLPGEVKR